MNDFVGTKIKIDDVIVYIISQSFNLAKVIDINKNRVYIKQIGYSETNRKWIQNTDKIIVLNKKIQLKYKLGLNIRGG